MPNIPLPRGIKGIKDLPRLKESMTNLIPIKDGAIRVPGITAYSTGTGKTRGCVTWSTTQKAYFVTGNDFLRVNSDGTTTNLGTISGTESDLVGFSQGQVNLLIYVEGGLGYEYNEIDGLSQITDSDYKAAVSADFIDGRHVIVPADGSPPFYTDIDDASTIGSLSFFDAEELPDLNRAVINVSNQLYVLGDGSTEVFRTSTDPDIVFNRREGGRIDVGYIGGLTRYMNSFAFLGRLRDEAPGIYVMGSGTAIPISNDAIDEILEGSTEAQLKACRGSRFKWKGFEVLVFDFTDKTLAYYGGEWFYLDSTIDGKVSAWRVRGICRAYGKYLVGDRLGSNIGYLSDLSSEYGLSVEWGMITFVRSGRDSNFRVKKLEIDGLTGTSNTEKSIGLSISKDGLPFGDFHYRSLGTRGEYEKRIKWQPPGGLGHFENYCGIKLRSNSDASFGMEALSFE